MGWRQGKKGGRHEGRGHQAPPTPSGRGGAETCGGAEALTSQEPLEGQEDGDGDPMSGRGARGHFPF